MYKIFLYKFDIGLCKFINKFIRCLISLYNLLIISIVPFIIKLYIILKYKAGESIFYKFINKNHSI